MLLAGATSTDATGPTLFGISLFLIPFLVVVAGAVFAVRGNRPVGTLLIGLGSLGGLVNPLLIVAGITALVLGWRTMRKPGASVKALAVIGMVLGGLGVLASLVFPGFIAFGYIYAATHGGQLPS
jgi:hypothetical protein